MYSSDTDFNVGKRIGVEKACTLMVNKITNRARYIILPNDSYVVIITSKYSSLSINSY